MKTFTKELAELWRDIGFCAAVCYTGYKERYAHLMTELKRVGIANPYVVWSHPSPYRRFILQRIPHISDMDQQEGYFGATWAHYRAVKIAYELGHHNAFICEDDCRFLKDTQAIKEYLSQIPSDYGVLMLDSFEQEGVRVSNYPFWEACSSSYSTAAYIVTRKAMKRLIDLYESPVNGKFRKPLLRNSDHWTNEKYLGQDIKIYYAKPNICIQCQCPGTTNTGTNYIWDEYREKNIDLSQYMAFDGENME